MAQSRSIKIAKSLNRCIGKLSLRPINQFINLTIKQFIPGQSLVEILLAISLASILLPALITGLVTSREGKASQGQRLEATALLKETEEAVRSVREKGWVNLQIGTYHPEIAVDNSWSLVANSQLVKGYSRQVVVSDAQRDSGGQIVESAGIVDTSTKKIISTVSWNTPFSSKVESISYFQRYLGNAAFTETTQADFSDLDALHNNTVATNGGPPPTGAVELAQITGGDWATPQVVATRNIGAGANANDIFVDNNRAYIVTNSQSGDPDFFIFDITNPENPTSLGSVDLGANGFAVVVSANYAYVATSHNNRELTVVDISNPNSPALVGSHFNSIGNVDGRSVAISGSTVYLVTDNNTSGVGWEFYSVNVSNPLSPSPIGGLDLGTSRISASARDIFVLANFAYVASTRNDQELQIVNISNPTPTFVGSYDHLSSSSDGQSIYVVGSTAYLTDSQLNILDVSNPSSVVPLGSYNSPGTPFGVFVDANFAFLAHSQNNSQFKVIDISATPPTLYGTTGLGDTGYGVFVVGDYAFLATANNNAEFQVVKGGNGSSSYSSSGLFISHASGSFDAGSTVAFNNLIWTANIPANTTLQLQIAVSGSPSEPFDYFGSDGAIGTYFSQSGQIPLNRINGRYLRYRATFTSNGSATPTLNDVSINYSP